MVCVTEPHDDRPDGPAQAGASDTVAPNATASPAGSYGPFAYLSAPNAPLYRRVMRALMAEKERFAVHVRAEQIVSALAADGGDPIDAEAVSEALDRLAVPAWGNLLAYPDSSRVTVLEDFYRRRMLYQLSREGEAAERALAQYDRALGSRGALQSVALEDIVTLLKRLREILAAHQDGHDVDTAEVHQSLRSLRDRFTELAENAVAFMGSIQRTIDLHDADVDAFLAYKEQLVDYLERFINDLVTRGGGIAEILQDIAEADVDFLVRIAAKRESEDAAPGEAHTAEERSATIWERQWSGLRNWFVSSAGRQSESNLLRARARSAIPALLAVVRALHDQTGVRTDRAQDYLVLARWFAGLPTDRDRHRLWRSAFGLEPVRHLSVTQATEEAWEAEHLGSATPWNEAPPMEISPQLRKSGRYERKGKAARVTDRSAGKRMVAERARAQAEQTERARRRLLTDGPRRLSAFGELDYEAFRLFLGLLGDALAAMGPRSQRAVVHTSDGELTVTLTRLPGAGTMTLETPQGSLSGPDHLVDIAAVAGTP